MSDTTDTTNKLERDLSDVKRMVGCIEAFIDDINATVTTLSKTVSQLQTDLQKTMATCQTLQNGVRTLGDCRDNDAQVISEKLAAVTSSVALLTTRVDEEMQRFADHVQTRFTVVETDLTNLTGQHATLADRVASDLDNTDNLQTSITSIKEDLAAQLVSVTDAAKERFMEQMQETNKQLSEQVSAQFASQLQVASASIKDDMMERLRETTETMEHLRHFSANLHSEVAKFRAFRRVITGT